MRIILIIGGGILQIPLIEASRSLQLKTLLLDGNPNAPGMDLADNSIIESTLHAENALNAVLRFSDVNSIRGVVTAGTDASFTVATIARHLGLPGIDPENARAATDKFLMRKKLRDSGIPVPEFSEVSDLSECRQEAQRIGFPLVMKPTDNMGARGVIRVNSMEEIHHAYQHSRKFARAGKVLIEEYMPGPELSVDAISYNGQPRISGIADRIITREPYFVEIGHNMPSALNREILAEAERVMVAGMKALGIDHGAAKGDLKVTPGGVKIGELAARLSGGFMSSHTYPYHSGVNLHRAAVQIAIGEKPDQLEVTQNYISIERSIMCEPGKILNITGIESARSVPGVKDVILTRSEGQILKEATSNIEKLGHIIVCADTLESAVSIAEATRRRIEITVDDSYAFEQTEIEEIARKRFPGDICRVCPVCDGKRCSSGIPGMGAPGQMRTFHENYESLQSIKIVPKYIRDPITPDTTFKLFGETFRHPIMPAPITGVSTNMGGVMDELDYLRIILRASAESGIPAWIGDSVSPHKFDDFLKVIETEQKQYKIPFIMIMKPRDDYDLVVTRLQKAMDAGALAVGMDMDSIVLNIMSLRNVIARERSSEELARMKTKIGSPFIVKGVLSVEDAKACVDAGIDGIVISNHGGRLIDGMPTVRDVISDIITTTGDRLTVFADGGVRSGMDVFRMLSMGAHGVLVGRPTVINAVGAGKAGVKTLLRMYHEDLIRSMKACGAESPDSINKSMVTGV